MTGIPNVPELTVSELAFSLKKTLEDAYGRVRVRGELSRVKIHTSGHLYSDLKDADAVINAICWKGTLSRLSIKPEEGLEVICTGRISSYPARSNYQLIIESMELAGAGALLKMLEERRKKLATEGLFDADRKKKLPFLPTVIGVVTSPTGAVIRDIMHRLDDRYPSHVLLWPVAVQGPGAAEQIAAAVRGFDAIRPGGKVPRPDVLIVARGGGSLEDLMAFNEENVVRAVASCSIPVIAAVGHETDTTLIDYAADVRAPTPTGAAEMAVPVRLDLIGWVNEAAGRIRSGIARQITDLRNRLAAQAARLGDPQKLLELQTQKIDHQAHRLETVFQRNLALKTARAEKLGALLRRPEDRLRDAAQQLGIRAEKLDRAMHRLLQDRMQHTAHAARLLRPPADIVRKGTERLAHAAQRLESAGKRLYDDRAPKVGHLGNLLESYSYKNVLARGFAVVRDKDGQIIANGQDAVVGQEIEIEFWDSIIGTIVLSGNGK